MMNRNTEAYFTELPSVEINRSIMDLSHSHTTSGVVGDLIPFDCIEVVPGDTFKIETSKVVRFQTMLTPTFSNIYMDVYWFFVPNRLVWTHWKEFCGENTASPWIPSATYTIPTISSPSGGFATNTIADYLHYPVGVTWSATDANAPSALPFRGYALIANEFYRDQNLTNPLNIPLGDANQIGSNGSSYVNDVANGGMPFKVAKAHDYYTSCTPAPQKGPSVSFDLINGNKAPVVTGPLINPAPATNYSLKWHQMDGTALPAVNDVLAFNQTDHSTLHGRYNNTAPTLQSNEYPVPSNLWADLSNSLGSVTINELRLAFQLQKFYEKQALAGSRYTEMVREMFGTISPDGRIQRPEYLGGNRVPIQVHQVANTAQTSTDFLGDVGAFSITADVSYDFEKSFTEHGYIFGLCCVRYCHTYSQGMPRHLLRKKFTDFYLPVFANIGNQSIKDVEIYADSTTIANDSVFGFNEAWAEYRTLQDYVSGEMRPGIANTLASWHVGDYYTQKPTLSDGWIREDPSNVDRILAVQSSNANQFLVDFEIKTIATRPMPVYSIPGLIDHH